MKIILNKEKYNYIKLYNCIKIIKSFFFILYRI